MSVSGVDQEYVLSQIGRQIYARPLGALAASMIGVVALSTLGLTLAVGARPPKPEAASEASPSEAPSSPQETESAAKPALSFAFDLKAPEFAKENKSLSSHDTDRGREDSLTLGKFEGGGPYLRLDLRQTLGERRPLPDFFLDLTRHASAAGLSAFKIGQPAPLATRFGAFEAADIRLTLATPGATNGERACAAFRLAATRGAPVEIAGLACNGGAKAMDRRALGCIIDHIEFTPGALAAPLGQIAQAAEADRQKACAPTSLTATDKTGWFDAHSRVPETKAEALPPKHAKKAR